MEFFIIFIVSVIVLGGLLLWYLEKCPHQWELIGKGDVKTKRIYDSNDEFKTTGYYEIHRCYNCKKLKRTQI